MRTKCNPPYCCRELFVVEVKNWSGKVELLPDGSWLQIRRNGTSQRHSNVVSCLKKHLVTIFQDFVPLCCLNLMSRKFWKF